MRRSSLVLLVLFLGSVRAEGSPSAEGAVGDEVTGGTTVRTRSGLQYIELRAGTGRLARSRNEVEIRYTGWLADGKRFDSSGRAPFRFQLGAGHVIQGLDEGVRGMRVGGKRRLILPPHLGYGALAVPGRLPPNATLIFEVELVRIR